jgi:hypothetical protein
MKQVPVTLIALVFILSTGFILPAHAEKETRKLETFTSIGVGISADVFYHVGSTHEIIIEGDEKDIEDLKTEVKDGRLQIKYENWKSRHSKLTLHITSSALDGVSVSGSAKFKAEDRLSSEEMGIALSGSGLIHFTDLEAEEVDVKISGSGNARIDGGNAEEMDVKISGSGKLQAEQLEVKEFSASISGSGGCKITVQEELRARISGSGSVYYHGNPRVDASNSGSGKVRSL